MSKKTLLMLAALLAVLVGALWISRQRASAPGEVPLPEGGALLPAVDMGTVQAITLEDGSATTRLARVDGIWCLTAPEEFPADFDRLQRMIRSIDGMADVQVADSGADRLAEFGLIEDSDPAPTRIILEHGQGTTVLHLGAMREPHGGERQMWGPPPGRYVRVDEGPVLLLKEDIAMAQADPGQWWDRQLLQVPGEAIREMEVAGDDGKYVVQRTAEGAFVLPDAVEGEAVENPSAQRLFNVLRNLRADRHASAAEEFEELFSAAPSCRIETAEATYRIQIGAASPDEAGSRPVKIQVTPIPEAAPDSQAATERIAGKLRNRIFWIPAYQADNMTLPRSSLVRKSEPPPEPAPAEKETVENPEPVSADEPAAEERAAEPESRPVPEIPAEPEE